MKKQYLIAILVIISQWAMAQDKMVTWVVKGAKGETLVGVNVLETGTTNGVNTDVNGRFTFILKGNTPALLRVSYIGYITQEIPVNGGERLDITLLDVAEELEVVVVVGYGQQKKESVGGAISQITSRDLLKSPAANISQAISGKLPGVITSQTSGAPGSDDVLIFIRGRASFTGDGQPLILVDGVERSFSQIAPDDIASVSTLKDASATAVYGVRGANGVILITTKRGQERQPTCLPKQMPG